MDWVGVGVFVAAAGVGVRVGVGVAVAEEDEVGLTVGVDFVLVGVGFVVELGFVVGVGELADVVDNSHGYAGFDEELVQRSFSAQYRDSPSVQLNPLLGTVPPGVVQVQVIGTLVGGSGAMTRLSRRVVFRIFSSFV